MNDSNLDAIAWMSRLETQFRDKFRIRPDDFRHTYKIFYSRLHRFPIIFLGTNPAGSPQGGNLDASNSCTESMRASPSRRIEVTTDRVASNLQIPLASSGDMLRPLVTKVIGIDVPINLLNPSATPEPLQIPMWRPARLGQARCI
jgi:hypothetical protein